MDRKKYPADWENLEVSKMVMTGEHVTRRGMHYQCMSCGHETIMWLEKGLEEGGQAQKPVPMFIRCNACGEMWHGMRHVGIDARLPVYRPIPDGSDYFRNDSNHECGIPVFAEPLVRTE